MIIDSDTVLNSIEENDLHLAKYSLPSTCHYLSKDYSFPRANKKPFYEDSIKQYPKVDPAKYSDTLEDSQRRYWLKASGSFSKTEKETWISKSMKKSGSLPGPGTYFPVIKEKQREKQALGKFGKESRRNFFSNCEALSEEVPSSFSYEPYPSKKHMFSNGIYHKPYFKETEKEKNPVGPGSYNPELSLNSQVLEKSIKFTIAKGKKRSTCKIMNNTYTPGVGSYPGVEQIFNLKNNLLKKKPIINSYSFQRFSENISKIKAWVPGPGAYNIGPLPKIYKPTPGSPEILERLKKPIGRKTVLKKIPKE